MKHFLANTFAIILILQMLSIFFSKENFQVRINRQVILGFIAGGFSEILKEGRINYIDVEYPFYYQTTMVYLWMFAGLGLMFFGFGTYAYIQEEIKKVPHDKIKLPGFMKDVIKWFNETE